MIEIKSFIDELHSLMAPEEKKHIESQQRSLNRSFDLKYSWAARAMRRRELVLSDPDLVFNIWLERSLDELFNGAA